MIHTVQSSSSCYYSFHAVTIPHDRILGKQKGFISQEEPSHKPGSEGLLYHANVTLISLYNLRDNTSTSYKDCTTRISYREMIVL